jgi:hypothetical protein
LLYLNYVQIKTTQIIARFTHAQKRSELLKATKNIPKIPDLKGIGISQDLTKNRSKIAYLTRQAVKENQINELYTDMSCLGGVFAKNTSRETKNFPSRMAREI